MTYLVAPRQLTMALPDMSSFDIQQLLPCQKLECAYSSIAKILTSNSVGTQLSFLGCSQDNIGGSNFITKKEIRLVVPEKEISNQRN